ncbi:MAG TPA: tetratricopeptide repeat protein [Bdellovibrionota bacterium]|nr:tetratricopeptide repeat protein [Bdellovibrionota bacterium]
MKTIKQLVVLSSFSGALAFGQKIDFPQCQSSVIGPQKIQAQSQNLTDTERVNELEQLLVDFRAIRNSLDSVKRVPTGYVDSCVREKQQMIDMHFKKLNDTTRKNPQVLKVMAQLLDVNFKVPESIQFYDDAYRANPADTESALRSLKLTAGLEFQNYARNHKSMTRDQKVLMLQKLLDKGYALASNPKFSITERIWAMEQVRGVLAANDIRPNVEESYWKRMLDLDPKSDLALRELMTVYESRSDFGKMSVYATQLAYHNAVKAEDVEKIGTALTKAEDESELLKVGNVLVKKFPESADAWGYLGVAEFRVKLYDKAIEHLEKSLGMKAKNPLFKASMAALLEEQADKAAEDKNWVEAMAGYREALKYNPNSAQLKKKTAYLLLDFHADNKFAKTASTKKDMDYALGLLSDALTSKAPLMADYAAGIRLGAHSSNPAKYRNLCDRYQSDRPSGLSIDIVQSCVSIYRSAGSEQKAKGIVDLALSKVKDAPAKQEFLKTLR